MFTNDLQIKQNVFILYFEEAYLIILQIGQFLWPLVTETISHSIYFHYIYPVYIFQDLFYIIKQREKERAESKRRGGRGLEFSCIKIMRENKREERKHTNIVKWKDLFKNWVY